MKDFTNLMDLMEFFKDEEFCHNFLKDMFWGKNRENRKCPNCSSCNVNEFKDFKKNRCYDCKFEFSIRKNTIFDDSKISLRKWFMIIYLANSNKKGVSSYYIAKQVGITQKSAWFMLQRIKNASTTAMFDNQFQGTIEIDEAYFGGKEGNMHKNKKNKAKKTTVIGMINRETKQAKAMKTKTSEKEWLLPKIYKNVKDNSTIVTDTYHAYKDLKHNYKHKMIKHSANEYYREENDGFKTHTNSIEGFWALVKRTIYGTHHWVSDKHINSYLAEISYRYNTAELADNERFKNFLNFTFKKITYRELIAN